MHVNTQKAETVRRLHQWANELRDARGPALNHIHPAKAQGGYADVSEDAMLIDTIVQELAKESWQAARCLIIRYFWHRTPTEYQRRLARLSRYQFLDYVALGEEAVGEFLAFVAAPVAYLQNNSCSISKRMVQNT